MSKVNGFMKNSGLPGSPVVACNTSAIVDLAAKGWVSDPGPATVPTFTPPVASFTAMSRGSLPGRTISVPTPSVPAYQSLGWS